MKINDYILEIKKLDACGSAIKDALNYKTSKELWDDCKRGDWMLWLVGKTRPDTEESLRKLVGAKVKCARLVQHLMTDKRSLNALDVAERFSNGTATRSELDNAAAYAADAAGTAAAYAADAAGTAAAYAADAAGTDAAYDAATYAAYAAADAADAADADAADAAAYAAAYAAADAYAKKNILSKCADIVRQLYPDIDVLFDLKEKGSE